jgi:putative ABC transport system permease protein
MVVAAVAATFLARIWPMLSSARTSVISHERRRARAPQKPLWQRLYLDILLLIPVIYAYRQLSNQGTLVPESLAEEASTSTTDPLMFLVPAMFTLAVSLVLVRLFPILMRILDWLGGVGRDATLYLAFRQLARQSSQYVSALLLVITSLSLGAFMASMAISLDRWLADQVRYAIGSDILIRQTVNPDDEFNVIPSEGAWVLPVDEYEEIEGVLDAARIGMYKATISLEGRRSQRGTFLGIDRLDLPKVLFFRSDFGPVPLGEMMNQLARREDAVLLSETMLERGRFD